jgi:hypothetical protein
MYSRITRLFALVGTTVLVGSCGGDSLAPEPEDVSLAAGGAPGAPSGLSATVAGPTRIDLAWQDNSPNETGSEVHRSTTGPAGAFTLVDSPGADVTTYSDHSVSPGTQYCYTVRAYRLNGRKQSYSAFSDPACATTPPASPSSTKATPRNSTGVDVAWADNSGTEDGFRVERAASLAGPWAGVATTGPNVASYGDGGLATEQQVCYRVSAFNVNGSSVPSNIACTSPPAAPTNLVATPTAGTSIDLTWSDNSTVDNGYEVHRALENMVWSVVATLPAGTPSYSDKAISSDTRYWYRVRANKDGGHSDFSNIADAIAISVPPLAPSNTRAVPNGSTSVIVAWTDGSSTENGFRIERSLDGGTTWAPLGTRDRNQQSFVDQPLSSEQHVCYQVFAFNDKGASGPSNAACTAPPAAPTGLLAAANGLTIDLTWTDNSNVENGYEVYRLFTACSYYYYYGCYYYYEYWDVIARNLPPNTRSFTDEGLNPWELYRYYVVAVKDGGQSTASNEASATPASDPD